MAELLSDKLRKQLLDSGHDDDMTAGLYDAIEGMSDTDLREYIWANRAYFSQNMPGVIEDTPDLQEYVNQRPNFGNQKVDLVKAFNDPDIMNKLHELDTKQIDYVARKNGMSYKDFVKQMWEQKRDYDRDNIAHGRWDPNDSFGRNIANEIGGTALTLFGKRQQEAIARGEDPAAADYAGDIGEQALYLMPWGRGLQAVGAAGKVAKGAQLASNAVAPVVGEAYDAAVYDEDNPRGEFNYGDVLMGTTTNLVAPFGVNRILAGGGRMMGVGGAAKEAVHELGAGKSNKQIFDEFNRNWTNQSYAQQAATRLEHGHPVSVKQGLAAADFTPEYKAQYDITRKKLLNGEKLDKADYQMIKKTPEFLEFLNRGNAPTEVQLATEEAVKNWATNTFGDKAYSDGTVSLPIVGNRLTKALEEERAIEASKQAEEESKRRIMELYGFHW